jgi:REP element-mobilizing transposase RayT
VHLAGFSYHVYNRGCNREPIFRTTDDYSFLLHKAQTFLPDYPLRLLAYCLMPNHYHFLLRPEEDGAIGPFLQRLFSSYTQAFNRQQGRSGTLFAGRAQSILVDTEEYLLHLCRYIHLNPVQAGLVAHPEQWPHSNYLEWIGGRNGTLVDRGFVRLYFPAAADYERFVTWKITEALQAKLQAYYLE